MAKALNHIDISSAEKKIILSLIKTHLPNTTVWAYGSRATWSARPKSDLDLVAFASADQKNAVYDLKEAFEESDLPFRVDFFVWDQVPDEFRVNIERERVVLVEGGYSGRRVRPWQTVKIKDIGQVFDGPHATPKKQTHGPVFLGVSSLDQGRLDISKSACLSENDFVKWTKRVTPRQDDVVFAYETRLGEAAIIPKKLRCCLGRRLALVRLDQKKVDPLFFLYQYLSPQYQNFLKSRVVDGSTVDRIHLKEFPNFPFQLPSMETQKAIAHILGTIDDKIALNRRMNETLEAMAQAIFKSWFVDFDGCTEFEDSELGRVPKGWKVSEVKSILKRLKVKKRYTKKTVFPTGQTPVFEQGNNILMGFTDDTAEFLSSTDDPLFIFGDHTCIFRLSLQPFSISQNVIPVRGSNRNTIWTFYAVQNLQTFQEYKRHWNDLCAKKTIVPPANICDQFQQSIKPLLLRKEHLEQQILHLSLLRDTLLPKLISGELRVDEAEKMVEGA